MAVFPLIAALISLAFAAMIGRDALVRPRPEQISWTIAFLLFAIASGVEALAGFIDWSPFLIRVFYLTGAVLVVGFLGLGEIYLLAPRGARALRVAPGLAILTSAIGATLIWSAAIDSERIPVDGWRALDRGPALVALVALCSGVGTAVLIGGALWSAWSYRRHGAFRHRMFGCLLIALGTLVVASKGTLGRTGLPEETFAVALAVGVAIIFAGYLETRRGDASPSVSSDETEIHDGAVGLAVDVRPAMTNGHGHILIGPDDARDPGIAFIQHRFLPLDEADVRELARTWSVPPRDVTTFDRREARQAWRFRNRLSVEAQERFDALSLPARLQLVELYWEVLDPAISDEVSSRVVSPF